MRYRLPTPPQDTMEFNANLTGPYIQRRAERKAAKKARKALDRGYKPASVVDPNCSDEELTALARVLPPDAKGGWVILGTKDGAITSGWASSSWGILKASAKIEGKVYRTFSLTRPLILRVQERQADLSSGLI